MNQEKIGKYIATCRKGKKLTQEELGGKLGITAKAISKWECGKGLPDASLMLDLCNILDISVNELLSGQSLSKTEIIDKSDDNLIKLSKEKETTEKAARYSNGALLVLILILNLYNIFKYGVIKALDRPEWFIMNIGTLMFYIIYIFIYNKNNK